MSKHIPTRLVCDFCCSQNNTVAWSYPAKTFTITQEVADMTVDSTSHGGWAACDACHNLIESNNRISLVERSFDHLCTNEGWEDLKLRARTDMQVNIIKQSIRQLQDNFFSNRLGPCSRANQ